MSASPVPPWVAPILALVCAFVAGLTSFGDAILFHILWAVAVAASGVQGVARSDRAVLTRAVLYLTVMPIANTPLLVYVARKHLASCAPYGVTMALPGMVMARVGAYLLFYGDILELKLAVGAFFVIFAVLRLSTSVRSDARNRLVGGTQPAPSDDNHATNTVEKSNEQEQVIVGAFDAGVDDAPLSLTHTHTERGAEESAVKETEADESAEHASKTDSAEERAVVPAASPPVGTGTYTVTLTLTHTHTHTLTLMRVSDKYSLRATLAVFLLAGAASGLLGGLFGTGGPPQMLCFALLCAHKDTIRGVSTVYGLLELGVRVFSFVTEQGSAFDAGEWPIYLGIAVASWLGFGAGTYVRVYVHTEGIIRLLLLLVVASSSILLGALDDARIATGFSVGASIWFVLLACMYLRPQWWFRLERPVVAAIRRGLAACRGQPVVV